MSSKSENATIEPSSDQSMAPEAIHPERPTDDGVVLRLIAQQGLIPVDQLARFLDLSLFDTERLVDRLCRSKLALRCHSPLGKFDWIRLTNLGAGQSNTGLRPLTMRHRRLTTLRAANEVRLALAAATPHGSWISRRGLALGRSDHPSLPNAVFEIGGERHAIDILLQRRRPYEIRQKVHDRRRHYDAMICFCSAPARPDVERVASQQRWEKLIVRDLPEGLYEAAFAEPSTISLRHGSSPVLNPVGGSGVAGRPLEAMSAGTVTPQGVEILRLISEQVAIPFDQLSRFLGVRLSDVTEAVESLEQAGYAETFQYLVGDQRWVSARDRGTRLSGHGFAGRLRLGLGRLRHTRAINEVRLMVAGRDPDARWICERDLRRPHEFEALIPDAALEVGEERHAIEVQLTPFHGSARFREVVRTHLARYDAVSVFCSKEVMRQLERQGLAEDQARLFVRELPASFDQGAPHLRKGKNLRRSHGRDRNLGPREREVVDLLAEQGSVRLDQMIRLVDPRPVWVREIVNTLHRDGFLNREAIVANEPDWLWLTFRGARSSSTELKARALSVAGLPRACAMNEIRIHVKAMDAQARWISQRMLRRGQGRGSSAPDAVIEIGDERHAILLETGMKKPDDLIKKLARPLVNYDATVCYCVPRALASVERTVEEQLWTRVFVRPVPQADFTPHASGPEES